MSIVAVAFTGEKGVWNAIQFAVNNTVTGLTTVSGGNYIVTAGNQIFNGGLTVGSAIFNVIGLSSVVTSTNVSLTTGILIAPSNIFNVSGTWTNSGGTFTNNGGTINLNGASNQSIAGTSSSVFNNLTLNNTNGATLNRASTVNGLLTLTNGTFTLTQAHRPLKY